jgi:hypothetical protein
MKVIHYYVRHGISVCRTIYVAQCKRYIEVANVHFTRSYVTSYSKLDSSYVRFLHVHSQHYDVCMDSADVAHMH